MTNVFVAAYHHPLETAKAFATLDALSDGRAARSASAPATSKASSTRSACRSRERGAITDEAIDAILAALDRRVDRARRTALEVRRRRPAAAPGAAAAPADLDRRFGQARAAARRGTSATAGSRRRRRPTSSPTTSRTSCASATRCGPARCPRSAITAYVYVGEPTWELPEVRDARLAERIVDSLNELGAIGVSHLQVRFARAIGRRAVRPGRARSAPRSARTSPASRC